MSTKATSASSSTSPIYIEAGYHYCNVCGRKSYQQGAVNNQPCNHFNSAPAKYPGQPCKGTMVASTQPVGQPITAAAERETS